MLIKNIFVYVSINKIGILIDWSDNKAIHVKILIIRCVLTSVCFHRNYIYQKSDFQSVLFHTFFINN
jgi:hypothetical protein